MTVLLEIVTLLTVQPVAMEPMEIPCPCRFGESENVSQIYQRADCTSRAKLGDRLHHQSGLRIRRAHIRREFDIAASFDGLEREKISTTIVGARYIYQAVILI